MICPQCKPVPRKEKPEILQVSADYRDIDKFQINQEILDLANKKSGCLCSVHSASAVGLDLSALSFYCDAEEHSHTQIEKDFKKIDSQVYKKLLNEIPKLKKDNFVYSETLNVTELKQSLEANLEKMIEKFEKCQNFVVRNEEIFETMKKAMHFQNCSDKTKLSTFKKVKFLEMKKKMEVIQLGDFEDEFKNSINTFSTILEIGKDLESYK